MKRLRFWTTILTIWLIFFFNIERINTPISIQAYTYIFVAIIAAVTLIWPRLPWLPYWGLLVVSVIAFLLFKVYWGKHLLWGPALPLTITQVSAVVLTGFITRQINSDLREFEEVINNFTFSQMGQKPKPFLEVQDSIYREVRRARQYQRPLSVVALKIEDKSLQMALPKIVKTIQQAMMKQYVVANVARILSDVVDDFGTISLRDNHFILVLPEKTGNEASLIAQGLKKAIQDQIGISLQTGLANFPREAITFEALIEQAIKDTEPKKQTQESSLDKTQEVIRQEGV